MAKAVEHPVHLGRDLRGWCKQDVRVDVALQCFARAADLAAYEGACTAQVHGPVQAQHIAVQACHLGQPQAAAFGEHDAGDALAVVLGLQL